MISRGRPALELESDDSVSVLAMVKELSFVTCLIGFALLASFSARLCTLYVDKNALFIATDHVTMRSPSRLKIVDVVVVAPSAADWADRRIIIRKQFPRNLLLLNATDSAVLKFAIGVQKLSTQSRHKLKAEQEQHQDMLYLDCIDKDEDLNWHWNWKLDGNVSATTSKVMLSIVWAINHFRFTYFFRLGDDSYFRIDKFMHLLNEGQIPRQKAIVGQILQTNILTMYQPYAQGMGYGLTHDLCCFITAARPWLLDTAPEDGVVSRWLFATGAAFVNMSTFRSIIDGDACNDDMVLAHKLPAEKWPNISQAGTVEC